MSAIASYQQFIDTIDVYKTRLDELREQNITLKKLLGSHRTESEKMNDGLDDLEYKLGQYQEAAFKLCQAIHYEQNDEGQLAHSTKDTISNFVSLWNKESKKIFDENIQSAK
jgi:FtsZ-binding cell division protein ZapB